MIQVGMCLYFVRARCDSEKPYEHIATTTRRDRTLILGMTEILAVHAHQKSEAITRESGARDPSRVHDHLKTP
jgi:hypothetical protein